MQKQLNTAILFIVFNRPAVTSKVFEVIKKIKPKRLYVSSDGPRLNKSNEIEKVKLVRQIITAVNWPCEVKNLFNEHNLGMTIAESKAMSWFFKNEQEGIILEDDTLPHLDFFSFCEKLLYKYRNNEKVLSISGVNFHNGIKYGSQSYYFSKYFSGWGWASWRRTWDCYDQKIKFWPKWKVSEDWINKFPDKIERKYWRKIFDKMYLNQIDTWDYSFVASMWHKGGVHISPNVNLISNIGFGKSATNTTNVNDRRGNVPLSSIGNLVHPTEIERCKLADKYIFDYIYGGGKLRMPWFLFYLPIRIAKFFLKILKKNLSNTN
jgi:hypothetical protein